MSPATDDKFALPLHSKTPVEWARQVLQDPIALLIDHAFLEKKAANNAMALLTRWPGEWVPGWLEAMTSVARDEAAQGQDVGQDAHPSSTATCWNQATSGGGSQMPAIRTSSRWANIGT